MSDLHATAGPLRQALKIFARNSVGHILCAGDVAGYGTELEQCIELLLASGSALLGSPTRKVWHWGMMI